MLKRVLSQPPLLVVLWAVATWAIAPPPRLSQYHTDMMLPSDADKTDVLANCFSPFSPTNRFAAFKPIIPFVPTSDGGQQPVVFGKFHIHPSDADNITVTAELVTPYPIPAGFLRGIRTLGFSAWENIAVHRLPLTISQMQTIWTTPPPSGSQTLCDTLVTKATASFRLTDILNGHSGHVAYSAELCHANPRRTWSLYMMLFAAILPNDPQDTACAYEGFPLAGRGCIMPEQQRVLGPISVTCGDCRNSACGRHAACVQSIGNESTWVCECEPGFLANGQEDCININECAMHAHNCTDVHSFCTDTIGSYVCGCNPGFGVNQSTPSRSFVQCADLNECALGMDTCHPDATCADTVGSFTCTCNMGFVGDGTFCQRTGECSAFTHNCDTHAICVQDVDTYSCQCQQGYVGSGTNCTDVDECAGATHTCARTETCVNLEGSYACRCQAAGFELFANGTCADINECARLHACLAEHSECLNSEGGYTCGCQSGYFGLGSVLCANIDECATHTHTCQDASVRCHDTPGSFLCVCNDGWEIYDVSTRTCGDLDECGIVCRAQSTNCTNLPGSFSCQCKLGFQSLTGIFECSDINECDSRCRDTDTTTCQNTYGSYTCTCNSGFHNLDANETCADIDECQGAVCSSICVNTPGSFYCACQPGFGLFANGSCLLINPCATGKIECQPNASSCVPNTFSPTALCQCEQGYLMSIGSYAYYIVTFDNGTIWNTSAYSQPVYSNFFTSSSLLFNKSESTPVYMGGPFGCNNAFLSGNTSDLAIFCSSIKTIISANLNTRLCEDIDECASNFLCPHLDEGCINTPGSYTCACPVGFALQNYSFYSNITNQTEYDLGCFDVDECLNVTACDLAVSVCNNTSGGYVCDCLSGYAHLDNNPLTCQDLNECILYDLLGQGVLPPDNDPNYPCGSQLCFNLPGTYECACRPGFVPGITSLCEDVDECAMETHDCGNVLMGTCVNTAGSYGCFCNAGAVHPADNPLSLFPGSCNGISAQCICTAGYEAASKCNLALGLAATCECKWPEPPLVIPQNLTATLSFVQACVCPQGTASLVNDTLVGTDPCSCAFLLTLNQTIHNNCSCPNGTQFIDHVGNLCHCADLANVTNVTREWTCPCESGYTQVANLTFNATSTNDTCQCFKTIYVSDFNNISSCIDVNECARYATLTTAAASLLTYGDTRYPCGPDRCTNTQGSFECSCRTGYENYNTTFCQDVNECLNATSCDPLSTALCTNTPGSYTCSCKPGFVVIRGTANTQCQDVDECLSASIWNNTCKTPHTCHNLNGTYECLCASGYQPANASNVTCIEYDECMAPTSPCTNAVCNNTFGGFLCTCLTGYRPVEENVTACEDIDECTDLAVYPCERGCTNTPGSYVCTCPAGYEPSLADPALCANVDECTGNPCQFAVNGFELECFDTAGSYFCECVLPYFRYNGSHCLDIDECTEGTHTCVPNAECQNEVYPPTGFNCTGCLAGYTPSGGNCTTNCSGNLACNASHVVCGPYNICQCASGYLNTSGVCVQIDYCTFGPCGNGTNATCVSGQSNYTCTCSPGTFYDPTSYSCLNCSRGRYAPFAGAQTSCSLCPEGKFSNATGTGNCTACPLGTVANSSLNGTACSPCAAGYYQTINGQLLPVCTACPPGKANGQPGQIGCSDCDFGTFAKAASLLCSRCSGGFYAPFRNAAFCLKCPAGTTNISDSSACDDCIPGFYANASSTACTACETGRFSTLDQNGVGCSLCAPGQYQNTTHATACNTCDAGKYAPLGTASCIPCELGKTQNNSAADSCNECAIGYFANRTGMTICLHCAPGFVADREGMSSCVACAINTYQALSAQSNCSSCYLNSSTAFAPGTNNTRIGCTLCTTGRVAAPQIENTERTRCDICVQGRYQTDTECLPCPLGQFQSLQGQASCELCGPGRYMTSTGASLCTPCPVGTFATSTGATNASVCQACANGTYQNTTGGTSCIPCGPGFITTSNVVRSTCDPCSAGYFVSVQQANQCQACPNQTFQSLTGKSSCPRCLPGFIGRPSEPRTVCDPCPIGFSTNGSDGAMTCTICDVGRFANVSGQASCLPCEAGRYVNTTGSSSCNRADQGWSVPLAGSTFQTRCSEGSSTNGEGAASCVPCAKGRFSNSSMVICDACPTGTAQSSTGGITCPACAPGRFAASTQSSDCAICSTQQYQPNSSATACVQCGIDNATSLQLVGDDTRTRCICPPGNTETSGQCVQCPLPTISTGNGTCALCPVGKIRIDAATCQLCPTGSVPNSNVSCLPCPAGRIAQSGNLTCTSCAAGFYSANTGSSTCTRCEIGRYQSASGQATCTNLPPRSSLDGNKFGGTISLDPPTNWVQCAPGFTSLVDNTQYRENRCAACPAGTYRSATDLDCNVCPHTFYCPFQNMTDRIECPPGTGNDQPGQVECRVCVPGKYQDAPARADCQTAPQHYYVTSTTTFAPCPPGQDKINEHDLNCSFCPAGKNQSGFAKPCGFCPVGRTNFVAGSATCDTILPGYAVNAPGGCPNGTFAGSNNSATCTPCAQGKYASSTASTTCTDCEPGKFQGEFGKATCKLCSETLWAGAPGSIGCTFCRDLRGGLCPRKLGCSNCTNTYTNCGNC